MFWTELTKWNDREIETYFLRNIFSEGYQSVPAELMSRGCGL